MNDIKIGWIGIGNMGVPMVKNMVKAGFKVTVYNRSTEKSIALQQEIGTGVANSPAELVTDSDFIISMLADDAALNEVYTGADGVLSGHPTKKLIAIDM